MVTIDLASWWNAKDSSKRASATVSDLANEFNKLIRSNLAVESEVSVVSTTTSIIKLPWQDGNFKTLNPCIKISNSSEKIQGSSVQFNECNLIGGSTDITIGSVIYVNRNTAFPSTGDSTLTFSINYTRAVLENTALFIFQNRNYVITQVERILSGTKRNAILSENAVRAITLDDGEQRQLTPAIVPMNPVSIMIYPFNDGTYKKDDLYYGSPYFTMLTAIKDPSVHTSNNALHNAFVINGEPFGILETPVTDMTYIFKESDHHPSPDPEPPGPSPEPEPPGPEPQPAPDDYVPINASISENIGGVVE